MEIVTKSIFTIIVLIFSKGVFGADIQHTNGPDVYDLATNFFTTEKLRSTLETHGLTRISLHNFSSELQDRISEIIVKNLPESAIVLRDPVSDTKDLERVCSYLLQFLAQTQPEKITLNRKLEEYLDMSFLTQQEAVFKEMEVYEIEGLKPTDGASVSFLYVILSDWIENHFDVKDARPIVFTNFKPRSEQFEPIASLIRSITNSVQTKSHMMVVSNYDNNSWGAAQGGMFAGVDLIMTIPYF